jgi:uncharacterized protein (DUF1786 family)
VGALTEDEDIRARDGGHGCYEDEETVKEAPRKKSGSAQAR